jgi:hypothetical protein
LYEWIRLPVGSECEIMELRPRVCKGIYLALQQGSDFIRIL